MPYPTSMTQADPKSQQALRWWETPGYGMYGMPGIPQGYGMYNMPMMPGQMPDLRNMPMEMQQKFLNPQTNPMMANPYMAAQLPKLDQAQQQIADQFTGLTQYPEQAAMMETGINPQTFDDAYAAAGSGSEMALAEGGMNPFAMMQIASLLGNIFGGEEPQRPMIPPTSAGFAPGKQVQYTPLKTSLL